MPRYANRGRFKAKRSYRSQRKLNPRQKRQVKRMVASTEEHKHKDYTYSQSPGANGAMAQLSLPTQGDGVDERVGDVIKLISLKGVLSVIGADSTNLVRLIIFRWKDNTSATTPLTSDLFESASPGPVGLLNYTNIESGRVKIIYDNLIALTTGGVLCVYRKISLWGKRMAPHRMVFNIANTTGPNSIWIWCCSDSVASSHPGLSGSFRLTYTDG